MAKNNLTKKQKVWNYLTSRKSITLSVAQNRFDVKNLRATISDLVLVENLKITTTKDQKTGETRYTLVSKKTKKTATA